MARTPRMNPYEKQISRLYESLILLGILYEHKVIGPHRMTKSNTSDPNDNLADFLKDLAHVCDYLKGGPSTTAIGLEDQSDCYKFWIALNHDPNDKSTPFLEEVLGILKKSLNIKEEERPFIQRQLFELYVRHAEKRVLKEAKNLNKAVKRCRDSLVDSDRPEDREMSTWLGFFEYSPSTNVDDLCETAYITRDSSHIKRLKKYADDNTMPPDVRRYYGETVHCLGRVMNHFKVIKRLVENSQQVRVYIEEFRVARVPSMQSVPPPQADGQTVLESILGRMVRSRNSPEWNFIEANMPRIEGLGLEERIKDKYEEDNFQPCIHAEIQVLEHFHRNNLEFAGGNPYVACSKPACFCCKLYFRHHPARPFEPESHEKIVVKWSPPLLLKGTKDKFFEEQRKLVSSVITDLKAEVLKRLKGIVKPPAFHFDSTTNITELRSDEIELYNSSDEDEYEDSTTVIFDRDRSCRSTQTPDTATSPDITGLEQSEVNVKQENESYFQGVRDQELSKLDEGYDSCDESDGGVLIYTGRLKKP